MRLDLSSEPLGQDPDGKPVHLRDIWPSNQDIQDTLRTALTPEMFRKRYGNVFEGPPEWRTIQAPESETYKWNPGSTYVQNPPYFVGMPKTPSKLSDIHGARELAILGDSI